MPRGVLFDLDETLIPETKPLAAGYMAVAREVWGAGAGAEAPSRLRAAARAVWRREGPCPDYRDRVHVGASDGLSAGFPGSDPALAAIRAFLPRFRAAAFDDVIPPAHRGKGLALVESWRQARWAAQDTYPGAHELLRDLRSKVRLGLVTNGPSDLQRQKLAFTGLDDYFDVVVASCDIGVGKPNPAIFEKTLDELGLDAADVVMVGNDLSRDIEAARSASIEAIWIQHGAQTGDEAVTDLHGLRRLLGA